LVAVEFSVAAAALVQVPVGCRKGGKPEAGGAQLLDNRLGLRQGLAVGEGHIPLEADFLDQPAEPDEGEFENQFSTEGADAGSQGAQCSHLAAFISRSLFEEAAGQKFLDRRTFRDICGHFV
jgi:hypothetical protein